MRNSLVFFYWWAWMCAFCNGLGVGKDRQMMPFAVSSIGLARQEQFWLQKMTTVPQRSSQMKIHDPSHPMREATTIAAPGPLDPGMKVLVVWLEDMIRALECSIQGSSIGGLAFCDDGSVLLCELLGLVYVIAIICVSTGIQTVLDFIDKCEDPSLGKELVHQQLQRLYIEDQLTDQCPLNTLRSFIRTLSLWPQSDPIRWSNPGATLHMISASPL